MHFGGAISGAQCGADSPTTFSYDMGNIAFSIAIDVATADGAEIQDVSNYRKVLELHLRDPSWATSQKNGRPNGCTIGREGPTGGGQCFEHIPSQRRGRNSGYRREICRQPCDGYRSDDGPTRDQSGTVGFRSAALAIL